MILQQEEFVMKHQQFLSFGGFYKHPHFNSNHLQDYQYYYR